MNKLIYIILLFGTLLFSCEEHVDIAPTDIIVGDASTITDLDRARDLLNGGYGMGLQLDMGDLAADNNQLAPTNTGQGIFSHNWQYDQSTPVDYFAGTYNNLRDINIVLSVIDGLPTQDASDEQFQAQIKAEALALRAYNHFELLKGYSPKYDSSSEFGVPVVVDPVVASQLPSRSTMAETIAAIQSDITSAIATFPSNTSDELWQFSKGTAYALAANVALYIEDWESAKTNAELALSTSGVSIASRTSVPRVWRDLSTDGVMMASLRSAVGYVQTFNRVTNADIFYFGSPSLYDMYEDGDIRKEFYFTNDGAGNYIVNKWPTVNTEPAIDSKIYRAAQMHLVIAEAAAQLNDLGSASSHINTIRANRISNPSTVSYTNRLDALADIYKERRLELAFEGDRFFQLKRLGLSVDRPAEDCVTVDCQLAANSFKFTLPIPEDEIFANPNMVQFPGY